QGAIPGPNGQMPIGTPIQRPAPGSQAPTPHIGGQTPVVKPMPTPKLGTKRPAEEMAGPGGQTPQQIQANAAAHAEHMRAVAIANRRPTPAQTPKTVANTPVPPPSAAPTPAPSTGAAGAQPGQPPN